MCEVLFLNSFPFTIWFYVLSHWHTSKLKGLTFASLVAQRLKHLPPIWETRVRSLGREDPLEKEMAIHSSILAWKIPWTEKPSRLQSTGFKESDTTERLHLTLPYLLQIRRMIFLLPSSHFSSHFFSSLLWSSSSSSSPHFSFSSFSTSSAFSSSLSLFPWKTKLYQKCLYWYGKVMLKEDIGWIL